MCLPESCNEMMNLMKAVFLYLSLLLFALAMYSYRDSGGVEKKFVVPVIKDTFRHAGHMVNVNYPVIRNYGVYIVSSFKKEIDVKKYFDTLKESKISHPSNVANLHFLSIYIDTSVTLTDYRVLRYLKSYDEEGERKGEFYKCFPVYLVNNSNSLPIEIGTNGIGLSIQLEALNKQRQWQSIGCKRVLICGTGLTSMYLNAKSFALTKIFRYAGSYKTKVRVRLGKIVSNSITMNINPGQFFERSGRHYY